MKKKLRDAKTRIYQVRQDFGLTQAKFADELGITQQWVSMIEAGLRKAPGPLLLAIVLRFGVNEDWIFNGKGQMVG